MEAGSLDTLGQFLLISSRFNYSFVIFLGQLFVLVSIPNISVFYSLYQQLFIVFMPAFCGSLTPPEN